MNCGKIGVGWIKLPQNRVTQCFFCWMMNFPGFQKKENREFLDQLKDNQLSENDCTQRKERYEHLCSTNFNSRNIDDM
jgi:hypothetical protein